MSSPAADGAAGRLEGLFLLAIGLACLGFQLWLPSTHVAELDYQAVAGVLGAERRAGDVVLLAPWWTERARIYAPPSLPVVGYQGSDADPLERHPRIWVLSVPGLPRAGMDAFEKAFSPFRTAVGPERRFGNLELRLYQNGRYRPLSFDASDTLSEARVYLESPEGNRQTCSSTQAGHRCPDGRVVAQEWHEVHFAPYPCIKLEAPGGQTKLVVELTASASERSTLLAGYIWEYGAHREGGITPATVGLEVNGLAQTLELPVGDELMHRLEGPPLPQGASVRLWLSSQNPAARVVCVVMTGSQGAP